MKPIIELKNGKLVEVGKSRGFGSANKTIIDKFLLDEFDPKFPVYFGYTQNIQLAETLRENTLIQRSISNTGIYQIGPSIGSHLGCKGIAIAYVKK
ncbi:DegV family protein [Facklamia sp. DSM 111018]|uniref:DegV family protein n=1 Tax=Facklamia lactis TaxID=2749967 RepID=A0ABS0LNW6_9LACT|nr:DegV family protein [Facklamia lactis]